MLRTTSQLTETHRERERERERVVVNSDEAKNHKAVLPFSIKDSPVRGVGRAEAEPWLHSLDVWARPSNFEAQRSLCKQRGRSLRLLSHLELTSLFLLCQRFIHRKRRPRRACR
jgi:hypothetical protein